ncbi:MAG: cation-translocating P-type ATPase [Chloroflexota bacterium]
MATIPKTQTPSPDPGRSAQAVSATPVEAPLRPSVSPDAEQVAWHAAPPEVVLRRLGTDQASGLSADEADRRLAEFGPNAIREAHGKSWVSILAEQFTSLMVVILIVAAVISFLVGDVKDTAVILAIVVLNAGLGFFQEYRAEKAIAALKKLAVPRVKVRRDGRVQEQSADSLVPGDIVFLEMGSRVPADGRVLEVANLRIEEAPLTGESVPVDKGVGLLAADTPLADQRNMVFMGTTVTYGRATAVVTGTGMGTQLGRIARMIQSVESEPTPLQRRLDSLGRTLAAAALAIVAIVFVAGLLRGISLELMLLTAISLAVAAVPEGLPAVITIALALGAQRMVRRHALIRKLPAVETLGSVTAICSDKTGTLTQNQMTVTVLESGSRALEVTGTGCEPTGSFVERNPIPQHQSAPRNGTGASQHGAGSAAVVDPCADRQMLELLRAGSLCNDAHLEQDPEGQWRIVGDPTEAALVVVARKAGLDSADLAAAYRRVDEIPFTSERKRMTTLHRAPDGELVAYSKGAVDSLLQVCAWQRVGDELVPLTAERRAAVERRNDALADRGLRVLGVAYLPLGTPRRTPTEDEIEREMVFLGMVGMIDPPRPEVAVAVEKCRAAGIRPVMITGDHPLTARAIGSELGMVGPGDRMVTGAELEAMGGAGLAEIVDQVAVYARVSPEHKLKIVDALQQKHQVVAMTGDGVNDAPALKKADIGVAMGITGTDVSKEAADMVLLDDNFATIVSAVEEGRVLYDNIRKFIRYLLTTNVGEIITMFVAILVGMPLPVVPIQILWINLVTDGLPAIALGFEKGEPGVMKRKPRDSRESVFAGDLGGHVLRMGTVIGLGTLAVMAWALWQGRPEEEARTMAFTTLALFQLWHVMALRSETQLLPQVGLFSNPLLLWAVVVTFVLQLAVVYLPPLQAIFDTVPLSLGELALCVGVSSLGYSLVEAQKLLSRSRGSQKP